jgi:DNA replication protein DnaC
VGECACGATIEPIVIGEQSFTPRVCDDCARRQTTQEREAEEQESTERTYRRMGLRRIWWDIDFECFTSEVDQHILAACREYVAGWPQREGLVLYSQGSGSGKTLLAASILKAVKTGYFINAGELLEAIRLSFNASDIYDTNAKTPLKTCYSTPLLVIDDLGAHKISEWVQEIFYLLLNHRVEELTPTIITTNVRNMTDQFGERIASRILGHSKLLTLRGGDYRREVLQRELACA